jgi:hypothetical protein
LLLWSSWCSESQSPRIRVRRRPRSIR